METGIAFYYALGVIGTYACFQVISTLAERARMPIIWFFASLIWPVSLPCLGIVTIFFWIQYQLMQGENNGQ